MLALLAHIFAHAHPMIAAGVHHLHKVNCHRHPLLPVCQVNPGGPGSGIIPVG